MKGCVLFLYKLHNYGKKNICRRDTSDLKINNFYIQMLYLNMTKTQLLHHFELFWGKKFTFCINSIA